MTLIYAILASSLAGEPQILQVPEGSTVTPPVESNTKPFTVPSFSYLLPEPMYDKALLKAKQLEICLPALDNATSQTLHWSDITNRALSACSGQFDVDATAIETLRTQVVDLEARALSAESRLKDVRSQRTVAWAIAGGLILGSATVIVATLVN